MPVVEDRDQYATDLMKCIDSVKELEARQNAGQQRGILVFGGLSGRLDQTVHTLSLLHKLRKTRERIFVVTNDCVAWVLDAVSVSRM